MVNGFSPDDAYDSAWYSVKLMKGKYTINFFRFQRVLCVAMSCGGDSFSPYGACYVPWDSGQPMKGKYTINYIKFPC